MQSPSRTRFAAFTSRRLTSVPIRPASPCLSLRLLPSAITVAAASRRERREGEKADPSPALPQKHEPFSLVRSDGPRLHVPLELQRRQPARQPRSPCTPLHEMTSFSAQEPDEGYSEDPLNPSFGGAQDASISGTSGSIRFHAPGGMAALLERQSWTIEERTGKSVALGGTMPPQS